MKKVLEQNVENTSFLIEATDDYEVVNQEIIGGTAAGGVGKQLKEISNNLDDISDTISLTCDNIQNKINKHNGKTSVSELTIEFGIKLGVEGKVIVASVSGEASFKVTAKMNFN